VASGTLREDRFDFGVPNSPRTKLRRTRIRQALQSTSRLTAQGEQLSPRRPGHRGDEVHHALHAPERVVRDGAQERLDLLVLDEADVGVGGQGDGLRSSVDRAIATDEPVAPGCGP
jgi:hypothetical protein